MYGYPGFACVSAQMCAYHTRDGRQLAVRVLVAVLININSSNFPVVGDVEAVVLSHLEFKV